MTRPTESGTHPFRWWVFDGWGPTYHLPNLPAASAPVWEARYENDAERRKRTTRRVGDVYGMSAIFDRLRSLADEWSARLGYPVGDDPTLHGGGVHVTEAGGVLGVHLDYDRHPVLADRRRALNLILFLNPEWRPKWGGALVLCDPMGEVVRRISPAPGRLAAFECSDLSYHGVEPTAPDAPPRLTAAVYYVSEAGPTNTRTRALFMPSRGAP
jgi:hypothetical protein